MRRSCVPEVQRRRLAQHTSVRAPRHVGFLCDQCSGLVDNCRKAHAELPAGRARRSGRAPQDRRRLPGEAALREEEERRRKEEREETRRLEEEREEKRRREEQEGTTVRLADQLALDVEDRLTKQYDAD